MPAPRSSRSTSSRRPPSCSSRVGSTRSSTTTSRCSTTWPRRGRRRSRSRATPEARSADRRSPSARAIRSCATRPRRRSKELRADGTLRKISEKYFSADVTVANSGTVKVKGSDTRSTAEVVTGLGLADAARRHRGHHPADRDQLPGRHGHRAGRGTGPDVGQPAAAPPGAVLHLGDPRDAAAGAAVHRLLRPPADRPEDPELPGGDHRAEPQRRRLRRRDHPGLDPVGAARAVRSGHHDRHGLRPEHAAHHPAAGGTDRRTAAVEHAALAGQGHLAGLRRARARAVAQGDRSQRRRAPSSCRSTRSPRSTTG